MTTAEYRLSSLDRASNKIQTAVVSLPDGLAHHVLASLQIGVIIADRRARLVYANAAADDLLDQSGGPLACRQGWLVAATQAKHAALRNLVSEASDTADPSARYHLMIPAKAVASPDVSLCITPFRAAAPASGITTAAVIFVRNIQRDCDLESEARLWFGLTGMESKIASALASGRSLAEVAATLHVSLATARSHLASAFQKTRTHQQSQLAALLRGAQIPLRV